MRSSSPGCSSCALSGVSRRCSSMPSTAVIVYQHRGSAGRREVRPPRRRSRDLCGAGLGSVPGPSLECPSHGESQDRFLGRNEQPVGSLRASGSSFEECTQPLEGRERSASHEIAVRAIGSPSADRRQSGGTRLESDRRPLHKWSAGGLRRSARVIAELLTPRAQNPLRLFVAGCPERDGGCFGPVRGPLRRGTKWLGGRSRG